ncbi:carbohydrate binding family 9 domain-containing protein [Candidatus Poribacteria bacterium]|nr:carbohydrate binding family 9 domain-containing protein [Candidatus Poribacteria bacterium]
MNRKYASRKQLEFIGTMLLILFCIQPTSAAQDHASASSGAEARQAAARGVALQGVPSARILNAERLNGAPPRIDGDLNEAVWEHAPVATGFVQLRPDEGAPASEPSEVRVLYGDAALYVAFRAFDSDPSAIQGQLTRRDQESFSDWVHVAIDSYNDKRTAFQFGVNPKGVKRDVYRFDDTDQDSDWDAVWDVETSVDEQGWTAEFRISYSQLRFARAEEQTWGIQFMRSIARKNESSFWAPLSSQDNAMVSRFGVLQGLDRVEPRRHLEVAPYSLARLQRAPGDLDNPFFDENDTFATLGMDVKYGLTGNLTLDVTVNPDFGQVEADPARVNLSEFETFFPERRPFFVEGANIFEFEIGDEDQLFHSRRIGRAPRRQPDPRGGYVDAPDVTTIQVAEKLSGKTESGWTIGLMHASTAKETAHVITGEGDELEEIIEPSTQYGLAWLQKDFRGGRNGVGIIATAVFRPSDEAAALNTHSDAIAQTQRAPSRYMQRPDASHVTYDPTRTSLDGLSASANVSKIGGGFWRYYAGFRTRTPEFETNDMGFMSRADFLVSWAGIGYDHSLPTRRFRRWSLRGHNWRWQTYGEERGSVGSRLSGDLQFSNYWNTWAGTSYVLGSLNTGMLRGGPAFKTEDGISGFGGFSSDGRKKVQSRVNLDISLRPESNSGSFNVSPDLNWRPAGRARVSVGTFYNKSENDQQWMTRIHTDAEHYIFGRTARQTVGLTGRFDFAFTPDLSLQRYAQPFVSAGRYNQLKQVADPLADDYANRFDRLETEAVDGGYLADVDGDGNPEFISNPDFNFKQFRSNAVLRWEYRPGSTLFVVWSQGRQHSAPTGQFDLGSDIGMLFDAPADDVFMVKISRWLNPYGGLGD